MYGFKEKYVVGQVPQSGDIRELLKGLTYISESTLE